MMKQVTTILAILVGFTMSAQLASVTENSKTGQRLTVSLAANHGDIGSNAVDLSYSDGGSNTRGATGTASTAMGYKTTASGIIPPQLGHIQPPLVQRPLQLGLIQPPLVIVPLQWGMAQAPLIMLP